MNRSRVVLLGWYGSDNTGDEAVLQAVVEALRDRGIKDLYALSINPSKTSKRFGLPSSKRSLLDPNTWIALRGARALVLGGGGLIQDRTSVYNLPIYAAFVAVARLLGLRVIGWGLGVEPLDTLLGKLLARFIVGSSAYFSVRDAGSKGLLMQAGVPEERVIIGADPAFLLKPSNTAGRQSYGSPLVVFCLRDLPDNRPGLNLHYVLPISIRRRLGLLGNGDDERTEAFARAVARAVRVASNDLEARVRFLSLWPGRDDTVGLTVRELAIEFGVDPERMETVTGQLAPSEVAAQVCQADVLVSMRLHALIFAATCGIPGLALAYARKMRGFMQRMGSGRWVVEVETSNPSPDEIETKLTALWEMREEYSKVVSERAGRARRLAEADADAIVKLLRT